MVNLNDKEVVRKITNTAKRIAASYGMSNLADDFVQEIFLKYLGGRQGKVSQLFIDCIREEFGDDRYETQSFKFSKGIEWEEHMDNEISDQHEVDFNKLLNNYEGEQRAMLNLYFKWGFTYKEIGETLGYSEAKVFLAIKEMEKKLGKRFGNA